MRKKNWFYQTIIRSRNSITNDENYFLTPEKHYQLYKLIKIKLEAHYLIMFLMIIIIVVSR